MCKSSLHENKSKARTEVFPSRSFVVIFNHALLFQKNMNKYTKSAIIVALKFNKTANSTKKRRNKLFFLSIHVIVGKNWSFSF